MTGRFKKRDETLLSKENSFHESDCLAPVISSGSGNPEQGLKNRSELGGAQLDKGAKEALHPAPEGVQGDEEARKGSGPSGNAAENLLRGEGSSSSPPDTGSSGKRTARSAGWSQGKKKVPADVGRKRARQMTKAAMVGASITASRAKNAGYRDAEQEIAEERDPVEEYFEKLSHWKFKAERSLGWILGHFAWAKRVHTHSWVVYDLLQKYRESGLVIEVGDNPDLVIGDCHCQGMTRVDRVAPNSHEGKWCPFFNQLEFSFPSSVDFDCVLHMDGDFGVFTVKTEGSAVYSETNRYGEIDADKTLVSKVFPSWRREHDDKTLFKDEAVRALIRGTRVYSEVTVATAVQNILANPDRPSYGAYCIEALNEAVLACFAQNHTEYKKRVVYGERRYPYDERLAETASGVTMSGKGVSSSWIMEMWNRRVKPGLRSLAGTIKDVLEERFGGDDCSGSRDSPSSGPSSGPASSPPEGSSGTAAPAPSKGSPPKGSNVSRAEEKEEENEALEADDPPALSDDVSALTLGFADLVADIGMPSVMDLVPIDLGALTGVFCLEESLTRLSQGLPYGAYALPMLVNAPNVPGLDAVLSHDISRYQLLFDELKQRGRPELTPLLFTTSNLYDRRHHALKQALCPHLIDPSMGVDLPGWTAIGPVVTWQETEDNTDGCLRSFQEMANDLPYDEQRIQIQVISDAPMPVTSFSEVYYGVYFHHAVCFGQDYILIALKKRLGRSVPRVVLKTANGFDAFCSKLIFPKVDPDHEDGIVDSDIYELYLANMPAASARKHRDYFSSRSDLKLPLQMPKCDTAFVKFDEVLLNPKGRCIINPPAQLFYELVVWTTALKQALKSRIFHEVYVSSRRDKRVFFSYGADMDVARKSMWMTRVVQQLSSLKGSMVEFYVLVGGDDNLCVYGNGEWIRAWESDVTACDQSHNKALVETMLSTFSRMGLSEWACAVWRDSYVRPLRIKDRWKLFFHRSQLHTGHPHTSLANTFVVGLMAISFSARMPIDGDPSEWINTAAQELGMIWKVEWHTNFMDATFHKGFWVTRPGGFQWLPLPSALWKALKVRTDSKIGHRELIMRMAFNCYQRIIYPNCDLVRTLCKRHFQFLMGLINADRAHGEKEFRSYIDSDAFLHYRQRLEIKKHGCLVPEEATMGFDDHPDWSLEDEQSFIHRRYGDLSDQALQWIGSWDGSFGVFQDPTLDNMIQRDYGMSRAEYAKHCSNAPPTGEREE